MQNSCRHPEEGRRSPEDLALSTAAHRLVRDPEFDYGFCGGFRPCPGLDHLCTGLSVACDDRRWSLLCALESRSVAKEARAMPVTKIRGVNINWRMISDAGPW